MIYDGAFNEQTTVRFVRLLSKGSLMSDESSGPPPDDEEPTESPASTDSKFFNEAYDKVAEIGEGRRWYDLPYRLLSWLLSAWPNKVLPRRWRSGLNYLLNLLIPFNEHDRHKTLSLENPLHNLFVPEDEHVTIPGIWVVELFPPSAFDALSQIIAKNSWDRRRVYVGTGEGNLEMLERSRSGHGWTWWRLGEIADNDSGYWFPDGTREKLPAPFGAIELTAIQIGSGLTAVVAYFHITADASRSVDVVWHEHHEPQLVRGKGRPKAEDRMWAAFRITQQSRRTLHDAARKWLALRSPGFFAANQETQPLMDMLLLDRHDPIPGERDDRAFSDALRAIGLTGDATLHRTSSQVPQMLFSPVQTDMCPALDGRTWALWGNRDVIANAHENLHFYGQDRNGAIAHAANRRMGNFLVMNAVSEFLVVVERRYAVLRDNARTRHGQFKTRDLRELRANLLTLSLDLASVARDVDAFWKRKWRDEGDAQFTLNYAPWIVRDDEKAGRTRVTPIDMNDDLRKSQRKGLRQLIASDQDYRDILSTVASLGASIDAFKVGRIAIWIAFVALVVALGTLLLTDVGPNSSLMTTWSWFRSLLER